MLESIKMAEQFLIEEKITVPGEFKDNARRFLYFQLFKTSLPFGDFLKEDNQWRGYVHIKNFELGDLISPHAKGVQSFLNGVMNSQPFLLVD